VIGLVLFYGFEEFDRLLVEIIRRTDGEATHRHSGMVRRFDLFNSIVNLSIKPVSACQPSRRAAAQENYQKIGESNQRKAKGEAVAETERSSLHYIRNSTYFPRAMRFTMGKDFVCGRRLSVTRFREHTIDRLGNSFGKVTLEVGCDPGRNVPFLVHRVGAGGRIIGVDYSQIVDSRAGRRSVNQSE
jgi:hypothetical protein